jgi:hypothetical protein
MIPTYFGVITLILGAWLLRRNDPLVIVCWMLGLGLFAASAALVLPALGSSSIPPAKMFLGFALLSVLIHVHNRATVLNEAVVANAPLVLFCIYGFIGALILPRIFAFQIDVVPMRPGGLRHLLDAFPLTFTPQNVTTAFYMIGTALTAIVAYIAGRLSTDVSPVVKTCVIIIAVHVVTGILGVALAGTVWDNVVDLVRNGSYSQLRQETDGFVRMAGLMPEPSAFASFGVIWGIFAFELWLRNIQPVRTGTAALAMTGVLAFSTSSTAYVAIASYMVILAGRFFLFPAYLKANKLITMCLAIMLCAAAGAAAMLLIDGLAQTVGDLLYEMVLNKAESESGQQRTFWAMQGLYAFVVSGGLGIGAGSFRSSSLVTAILGSMGVFGAITFAWTCASLLRQRAMASVGHIDPTRKAVGDAAAWAALAGLIPPLINGASPDPGMEFAALAGLALALRRPALSRIEERKSSVTGWGGKPVLPPVAIEPEVRQPGGWRRYAK